MKPLIGILLLFFIIGPALGSAEKKSPPPRVPAGFTIETVAAEPDVVFPMFAVFDDRGRLFVAESSGLDLYKEISAQTRKCWITVLDDPDDKGRFRKSRVFADKLVFPMGLAWREGKLYVADPPDLVVLEDPKGTGTATRRTVLLTGFGHRDNGSLHGLTFGPDGLLYMTLGHPDGYQFKLPDGTVLKGQSGALLRCRPDGSQPEVLSRGFENLVEIAFTPRGEIIGTDNWFQRPVAGLRDALVHLVDGGLYPMHHDVGTPQPITGDFLPPVSLFPAVALSGMIRYRGPAFPAQMHGNLFTAQHNARKVMRHVLLPHGSTFRTQDIDFVTSDDPDFHPSDLVEAPDGSLLIVDTGSWYVYHCPTGKIRKVRAAGGIYRIRPKEDNVKLTIENFKLPIMSRMPEGELAALLADPRPALRDRAQDELVRRGEKSVGALSEILSKDRTAAKQRAIWTLVRIGGEPARSQLRKALSDPDADVQATAARALGRLKDRPSAMELAKLLSAPGPMVRLAAAEALAHAGAERALPALWKVLQQQPDRFLEHAVIHALHHIASQQQIERALEQPAPALQTAALLLLSQPPRSRQRLKKEMVLSRVTAADGELRQTALRILQAHPEWSSSARDLVRVWLEKPRLTEEEKQGLRDTVLAFQRQAAVQELLGSALANRAGKTPVERRVLLLETLAGCTLENLPSSWVEALGQALEASEPNMLVPALRTAGILQVRKFDLRLQKLAEDAGQERPVRLEALQAWSGQRPRLPEKSFDFLLERLGADEDALGRLAVGEILARCPLDEPRLLAVLEKLHGDSLISPTILLPLLEDSTRARSAPRVVDYLSAWMARGWRPAENELAKVLAVLRPLDAKGVAQLRLAWKRNQENQEARLAEFMPLLSGGQAERGRLVFFGKKATCATCHRVAGAGGQTGPDLTRLAASRAGRDILESVLFPSSTMAQGYENFAVETKDGRAFAGILARQNDEVILLRDASGGERRLTRNQIQAINRLTTSLMPEGLERNLNRDELRDLLAYLQGLK